MCRRLFLLAAMLCCATWAASWTVPGHEQIADIAWTQLNDRAKGEIARILMAGDSYFRPSGSDEANIRAAFRKAAGFPDHIKRNRGTVYENLIAGMNARWRPDEDPDVSPEEATRCRTWHYYNQPIRYRGVKPAVPRSNALNALSLARDELRNLQHASYRNRRLQGWWLSWVLHLTGDLHQPLHCTQSFEHSATGDAGGNLFKVAGGARNLHFLWDLAIDDCKLREKLQHLPDDPQAVSKRWSSDASIVPTLQMTADLNPLNWINMGAALANARVYQGIERGEMPGDGYLAARENLGKRQAMVAGYRLARMLNQILGK